LLALMIFPLTFPLIFQNFACVYSSGAPNLSLWSFLATALPPIAKAAFGSVARAAAAGKPPAPLKKKVYVTFQTNEGDTPKIVVSSQALCRCLRLD